MPTYDDMDKPQPTSDIRASYLNAVVARNVVRLRQARQLSQLELAERAALPRFTLAGIESGRRIVGLNDLPGLCMALECNVTDLMDGEPGEPVDRAGTPLGYARRVMLPVVRVEPIEAALRRLIRDELLRP